MFIILSVWLKWKGVNCCDTLASAAKEEHILGIILEFAGRVTVGGKAVL